MTRHSEARLGATASGSIDQLFSEALRHHQLDQVDRAESLYRDILAVPPIQAEACYNLGLIYQTGGRPLDAISAYRRAVQFKRDHLNAIGNMAIALRALGLSSEAGSLYLHSLVLAPDQAAAYVNLGIALIEQQQNPAALATLSRALLIRPDHDAALVAIAPVLLALEHHDAAMATSRRAIRAAPEMASSYNTLGRAAEAKDRKDIALLAYRSAVLLQPDFIEAHYNLGMLQQTSGHLVEAVSAYRKMMRFAADQVEIICNMATALLKLGEPDKAMALFRQALAIRPDYANGYGNFGVALKDEKRPDEAVRSDKRAVQLRPDLDWAHANLSASLLDQDRVEESIAASRQAIALNSRMPIAHFNLGAAFKADNRLPEAEAAFRDALRVDKDFTEAHFTLSQVLLHQEKYEEGWDEYEWRWKLPQYVWLKNIHGDITQPFWRGEDISGKTLLVYAEQGLGDAIQYVRYIPLLIARTGAKIILAVHPPLKRLCQQLADVTVTTLDMQFPPFDLHCPLLSLPRLFRTRADSIPADIPYLRADEAEIARWRKRIGVPGKRVGIVWSGNPTQTGDRLRSPRLAAVQTLFSLTGITFVALQLGAGRDEIAALPLPANVIDLGPEIKDLADTAAIMSGLDAMVSSCTAPLHLSAALGVKTWGMIPFAPHFLWFKGRTDNPWYPTLTLYHQDAAGRDWSGVIRRIADDLQKL